MTGTRGRYTSGPFPATAFGRFALLSLAALASLAITACAIRPADEAAQGVIHVHGPGRAGTGHGRAFTRGAWPREDWWRIFGDAALNRLIDEALVVNPDVAAARARVAAAAAAVRETRSRLLPHLGAEAGLEGEYFSATGEHSLLNGRSVMFGRLDPVRAVYNPDISGRNGHELAAAVGRERARQAQRAAVRLDISTSLARTWFAVTELDGALAAEARRLKLMRKLVGVQKVRLAAGLADADGLYAARQALAQLRLRMRVDEGKRAGLLAAVAALAGQPPARTAGLRPRPPSLNRFPVPGDLPIGLLRHRPDVMAALWAVEAARQQVASAHAAFYPRLNLALFAGWNSIHLADLLDPANFARGIGLTLSLPVFEGGALRARLAAARARYNLAVDHYNERVLSAVKQVAASLAAWNADHDALAQSRRSVAAAKARVRVREAAFHAGLADAVPSVTAGISASEQIESDARRRASAAASWVDLVAALGGGYKVSGADAPVLPRSGGEAAPARPLPGRDVRPSGGTVKP